MDESRTTRSPSGGGAPSPDGLLVVDKPAGWTSHDVVARARRILGTKKVGHAGTLDPMATGVLVLGVGRSTRLLTYVVGADKTYLATIRLGQDTVTDDAEGEVTATRGASGVERSALEAGVARLTGDIEQVPSAVSAIKVGGRRSYARVRAGEDVALSARPVSVTDFTILATRSATADDATPVLDVDVSVTCSSGTYVRALARDLGADLGTGGHLTALRRTRVAGYTLDAAIDLASCLGPDGAVVARPELLTPALAAAAAMPVRRVTEDEAVDLGHGRWLAPTGAAGPHAAIAPDGRLLAVLEDQTRRGELLARPVVVHGVA
ncbi:MAG: tRNA pseudouridine(55) synthase TruB [Micrococcales bacterium 73-15]|nr:tRNA pseudouridine(55) synthase TruB [Salana multivorans]OJX95654.1 MAG: tRNA pseudouridine(55) synthase TruB [Micrococcales bacterium 73-15]